MGKNFAVLNILFMGYLETPLHKKIYSNIKVDIWHPAVGLRCRNPPRHLSQLNIWILFCGGGVSSISIRFKPYFRWRSEVMELPEFTWPLRMTGSDMTGNGHDRNRKSWPWSRAHVQPFPAVFSYYGSKKCRTVVQVPVLPDVILKGGSHGRGVSMRNRKLPNLRPSGAFWPKMTSSDVTRRVPLEGSAHAWLEVPLGCSLGRPRPIIVF